MCNFDGLLLEPDASKELLERADANKEDPELGKREYCLVSKSENLTNQVQTG